MAPEKINTQRIKKILVVDDDIRILKSIRLFLRTEGYKVITALSAEKGLPYLDLSNPHVPDLVITDVGMEGMSSIEFIDKIRKSCPHARIIVMSGYGDKQIATRCIVKGTDGSIDKPFTPKQLYGYIKVIEQKPASFRSS
jgi:DNA-binding response OmpR family regulator